MKLELISVKLLNYVQMMPKSTDNRGLVYQKTGQQNKSEDDFKKAKELDPDVRK